jgi:exoribonuclease II
MRDTLTFTIDPKDAKDFDDALSFKKLENGNYEIVFILPMFRIILKKEQSWMMKRIKSNICLFSG